MEYRTIIDVEFREYDRVVLMKSREWLNDPEMRSLTITPNFNDEKQEAWFQSIQGRNDYYIRSLWRDNEPIGALGIKHITDIDGEIWGYIGEKKYWGKAIGVNVLFHLLNYARSKGLQSVYATLLKNNHHSYKLLKRFGFEIEKALNDDLIIMRFNFSPSK